MNIRAWGALLGIQIECLLPAQGPFPKGPVMKPSSIRPRPGSRRMAGWADRVTPEAGPTDADLGTAGHLPAAPDQQAGAGAQGLPLMEITGPMISPTSPWPGAPVPAMDWYPLVVAWRLSNTLDADETLHVITPTKGASSATNFWRSTGSACMDGKGRYADNIFAAVEDEVRGGHLKAYSDGREAKDGIEATSTSTTPKGPTKGPPDTGGGVQRARCMPKERRWPASRALVPERRRDPHL